MSASFLLETDDNVLLCVVGPTASQKTALAIRLCEQWDGEVIGADSVQIYQHFDIGSGKPTARELAQAAHHLVGIVDPRERCSICATCGSVDPGCARERKGSDRLRRDVSLGSFLGVWARASATGFAHRPKKTR